MLRRRTALYLVGSIPDQEEALGSRYVCLIKYVNAGQQACQLCIASSTAADPRPCSSRPCLPDAQARRAPGALHGTAPSLFV